MAFVNDEVPTWLINWVNKVYILLNTPSQMVAVNMDWANYVAYVLVGNVLTLTDAPTVSITVDYITGATIIPATTDITFWEIKAEVWALLWQKSTSTNFSDTRVWRKINEVIRKVWRGRITSLLDPNRIYRAGSLWFTNWQINLRYRGGSSLNTALNVWDVSASCDTTYMLSNWYVEIGWDIVKYTSSTASTIDWVIGQTIEHLEGEKVVQLYEVPIDFERPNKLWLIKNDLWYCKMEIPYDDTNTIFTSYHIVRVWSKPLIAIRWLSNDNLIEVQYVKSISDMSDDTTVNPFPDDYWLTVIANLVAWEFSFKSWMPNSQQILVDWYDNLQNMYQFYTNTINIIKQTIRPISYRNK